MFIMNKVNNNQNCLQKMKLYQFALSKINISVLYSISLKPLKKRNL